MEKNEFKEEENFIRKLFTFEQKMEEHFRKRELTLHNDYVKAIREICIPQMILASEEEEPLDELMEMVIETNRDVPVNMRVLFKISKYENPKYGTVFINYTSIAKSSVPDPTIMAQCFAVATINGDFKIVAKFFLDHDSLKWSFGGGDDDLRNFYHLGKFLGAYRLMPQHDDDWSIKEYEKEA